MRSIRHPQAILGTIGLALAVAASGGCRQTHRTEQAHPAGHNPPASLTASLLDLAAHRENAGESLARLCHALECDPSSAALRDRTAHLLAETHWLIPVRQLRHPLPIDRIHCAGPSDLWVGLHQADGRRTGLTTLVRWQSVTGKVESVMFPAPADGNRALVIDPTCRRLVIARGESALLCDASTLHPIRAIDPLPDTIQPSSCVVFSSDGLLLAHPARDASATSRVRWQIRDSQRGEILREEPSTTRALPLAAHLDTRQLRVLHSDGSLLDIPVSPVGETKASPTDHVLHLTHALFTSDGTSALVQEHLPPVGFQRRILIGYHPGILSTDPPSRLHAHPWNRYPGIGSGWFGDPPLRWNGSREVSISPHHAHLHADSDITALAIRENHLISGDSSGLLTVHRIVILPDSKSLDASPTPADPLPARSLLALRHLTLALTGLTYRPDTADCHHHPLEDRLSALRSCDFPSLSRAFPLLDVSPLLHAVTDFQGTEAAPDALSLLDQRLARFSGRPSLPMIEESFANADESTVTQAIESAPASGAEAATCLSLALSSSRPSWIARCLTNFPDMPPTLARIARTRLAWLENRKAEAIAAWPDPFPDWDRIRKTEDWDGWEAADFRAAFELIRHSISAELSLLTLPDPATQEQRDAVFQRLTVESTLHSIGRSRYARACLDAAQRFAASPEETTRCLALVHLARSMGAPPARCLRTEALALTSLGDHKRARDRWIDLLTLHPLADHLAGDYAEAAYCAFENQDSSQALAILATGSHRFPHDASYALRAGWIALLTGHPQPAWRFLARGEQAGFPASQVVHATALLAIAADLSQAPEEAAAYHTELIRMDASWTDEKHLKSLGWPDDLTTVLRRLAESTPLRRDR